MNQRNTDSGLCEKINAALRRSGLADVHCETDARGAFLTGHVKTDSERAIAFAIARTTAGAGVLSNRIIVMPDQ